MLMRPLVTCQTGVHVTRRMVTALVVAAASICWIGHALAGEAPSLLDAARKDGEVEIGRFQDDIRNWDLSKVRLHWRGSLYQPVRCADPSGHTLYHLWVDDAGQVVTDRQRIEELFTALLFLPATTPDELTKAAREAEKKTARYAEEASTYKELAGQATAVQVASQVFSAYMSPGSALGTAITARSTLSLFADLMRLHGNEPKLTEDGVRQMLKKQKTSVLDEVLGIRESASTISSLVDIGQRIQQRHDLAEAVRAETNLLRKFRIRGTLKRMDGKIKTDLRDLGWSTLTSIEATDKIAQQAVEFTLMNRSAATCRQKLADLYGKAARGQVESAEELQLLSIWGPMTVELRLALLERYLKAYRDRKKTISGKIGDAIESLKGVDVEAEAAQAITENRHLLTMEREWYRRSLVSSAVETEATVWAIEWLRRSQTLVDEPPADRGRITRSEFGPVSADKSDQEFEFDVADDVNRIEVSIDGNRYGGRFGELRINDDRAWNFYKMDEHKGAIFYDALRSIEEPESAGKGCVCDVTRLCQPGTNTLRWRHDTEGMEKKVIVTVHRDGFYIEWPFPPRNAAQRQIETARAWDVKLHANVSLGGAEPIEMILIPPGEFVMGSPEKEGERNELPAQRVRLTRPFYLGVCEVTRSQFLAVMGYDPTREGPKGTDAEGRKRAARFPVTDVSWYEAVDFCNRLSKREGTPPIYRLRDEERDERGRLEHAYVRVDQGLGYRLPTEAEWECACRAGSGGKDSIGGAPLAWCAWYTPSDTDRDDRREYPHPVSGKRPNPFGLYDMLGNVSEWCLDGYLQDRYRGLDDDLDWIDPAVPSEGRYLRFNVDYQEYDRRPARVSRGGDWDCPADWLYPANRFYGSPSAHARDQGLRIARTCRGK